MVKNNPYKCQCKNCKKKFINSDRSPLYIVQWRQQFDADEFCCQKCCKEYAIKYGVEKICKQCRSKFYVMKDNMPSLVHYCDDKCVRKATEYIDDYQIGSGFKRDGNVFS